MGCEVHQVPIEPVRSRKQPVAQSRGAFDDTFKHGLRVCLRTADHTEDFARSSLLLEGLD